MSEDLLSHCIGFLSFVQVAVALNFGFMYLERKSSAMRLSDMFYDGFLNIMRTFTLHAVDVMKRVRKRTASEIVLNEYESLKSAKIHVVNRTDDLQKLGFLKPMGVIVGIYALLALYIICCFGKGIYYVNLFLVISEITFVANIFIFVIIVFFKCSPHVLRYAFLYAISIGIGVLLVYNDCTFEVISDFECWFHYIILIPYVPVLLFLFYNIIMYMIRIPKICMMICHTRKLYKILQRRRKRTKENSITVHVSVPKTV